MVLERAGESKPKKTGTAALLLVTSYLWYKAACTTLAALAESRV